MIGTVVRLGWLNLRRDAAALVLTFVLPPAFFSIFALVFGGLDRDAGRRFDTAVVNVSGGEFSAALVADFVSRPELRVVLRSDERAGRAQAEALVGSGTVAAAVVIPAGFDDAIEGGEPARVELLADTSNPLAVGTVGGLLNAAALQAGYELGLEEPPEADSEPLTLEVVDVLGSGGKRASVSYFAAGIGVLFLLFSMSNRSSLFIDEKESGVLERLLASELGPMRLLAGRWLFLSLVGTAQVSVMFVWAALAFGLPLWQPRPLAGFAVMTVTCAVAAAAFGMLLALLCRTREQLTAVSSVVVLVMAAVGGNLFPRFLMPESLQTVGLVTFNAWALDGYHKVFWYDAAVPELAPQAGVLLAAAAVFFLAARGALHRWQRA